MTAPRHLHRRLTASLFVALVVVLVAGGCGIGTDETAREIPSGIVPESLRQETTPTTTGAEIGETRSEIVYLISTNGESSQNMLVGVRVNVTRPDDPGDRAKAVTEALVAANPDALGKPDLVNQLPPDTEVLSAELSSNGILDLDLTELDEVENPGLRLAIAQIVFTLTELNRPRIEAVRFSVDGTTVAVPVEEGTVPAGQPVTRSDDPMLEASRTIAG